MEQLQCPLCNGVSPGDAGSCSKCGALFSKPAPPAPLVQPWDLVGVRAALTGTAGGSASAGNGTTASAAAVTDTPPPAPPTPSPRWVPPPEMGGAGWGIRQQQDLSGPDPLFKLPDPTYSPRTPVNGPPSGPRRNAAVMTEEDEDLRLILKRILMGIAGVAVVGLLAMVVPRIVSIFTTVQYHPISMPNTLSGATVMPDSSWADVSSSLKTNLSSDDGITSTAAAVYGAANNPQFILVAEQGKAVSDSNSKGALVQFATLSNYMVNDAQITTQKVDGTEFTCAPVSAGSTPTAACTWVNGQLRGFAWAVNSADPANALRLAQAASPAITQ